MSENQAEVEIAAPISVKQEFGLPLYRQGPDDDSVAEVIIEDKPEAFPTFPLPARHEIYNSAPPCTQTPLRSSSQYFGTS